MGFDGLESSARSVLAGGCSTLAFHSRSFRTVNDRDFAAERRRFPDCILGRRCDKTRKCGRGGRPGGWDAVGGGVPECEIATTYCVEC